MNDSRQRTDPVHEFVRSRIEQWQATMKAGRGSQERAILAKLRRGVGKRPGEVAEILPYTLGEELVGPGDGDGEPTPREWAAHIALTLYAAHQQSQSAPMHQRGERLGSSARRLVRNEDLTTDPVTGRITILTTTDSRDTLVHHARGLVQLLRQGGRQRAPIAVDYGLLAEQLLWWQRPRGRERVRLTWGRDFYVRGGKSASSNEEQPSEPA